jgi:hypothetical protein
VPDLRFQVEGAEATPNAATPQIGFKVHVTNAEPATIHSIALRTQVQIEPVRRRYTSREQERLKELFGEPERWSKSVHPLLWSNVNLTVPGFSGEMQVEIAVPCTFDFNVAVTKYIHGLDDGEIPTTLLFSGTVFYSGGGGLQVSQIPWDRSANHRLPVSVWREMMNVYYPNTAWLCLRRDAFERLYDFKIRHGIATWEQTIERALSLPAGISS